MDRITEHPPYRLITVVLLALAATTAYCEPPEESEMSIDDLVLTDAEKEQRARLLDASGSGDLETLKAYIAKGGDPDLSILLGDSLLCRAVAGQQVGVVRYLLARGADPEMQGGSGKNRPLDIVAWLKRSDAVDTAKAAEIEALLQQAIAERLIERPIDEALYAAISSGDLNLTRKTIAEGADVNRHDKNGISPLEMAVRAGIPALVDALFQAGARMHIGLWKQLEKDEIADIDPEARAEMERLFTDKHTAEWVEALKEFIREGAFGLDDEGTHRLGYTSLNDASRGSTFLMGAAASGDYALCKFLLELGVDPAVTDPNGDTAEDYVCRRGGDEETKKRILALLAEYEPSE